MSFSRLFCGAPAGIDAPASLPIDSLEMSIGDLEQKELAAVSLRSGGAEPGRYTPAA